MTAIQELSKKFNWNFAFKKESYFITKHYSEDKEERRSIIQLVSLPNLDPFYKKLNKLLGTKFDTPFPHITPFTNSTNKGKKLRGIGIYSKKQFRALNPIKIKLK